MRGKPWLGVAAVARARIPWQLVQPRPSGPALRAVEPRWVGLRRPFCGPAEEADAFIVAVSRQRAETVKPESGGERVRLLSMRAVSESSKWRETEWSRWG